LNIVVCVKQVPDTTAKKGFGTDFRMNRGQLESVINPFDEYAIEEGLRLKETVGGEVTILTVGPASAEDTMRKALAMGADKGLLVTDENLAGSDWLATARALAVALGTIEFDLVLTGMESTDARTGILPAGLAEHLGLPALTYASKVAISDGVVKINRQIPGGYQEIEATLPAVVSVVKGINEPRYPSLKGIMSAKRKEIQKLSADDVGLPPNESGLEGSKARVTAVHPRPEKAEGIRITPATPQEAADQVADFLQSRKFI
jgi:electron transfer flavoprotein beta subunit